MILQIDKFLGLRYSITGDTNIISGQNGAMELSECKNIRITSDYKARKREGYIQLFNALNKPIQGQWEGTINGVFFHLFACDGKLYKTFEGENTEIGALTDAPTQMFFFNEKVYIQNGAEYKSFDGTNLIDVVGYTPILAIGTPPSGGGTPYEQVNLLIGQKRQRFSADGIAKDYFISEQSVASIDKVYVNKVLKTVTTDYTVDLTTGKISFVAVPLTGQDNVEIWWTKGSGFRADVVKYKFNMFYGGKNDTRVFLYGDGSNKMIFSGLADGVPSMEYFPALNYSEVGSDENALTYVTKQYDRQVIFTTKGSYYSVYEFDVDNLGVNFPIYPLNDKVGNIPMGQGQMIQNNPFTLFDGVYQWVSTGVRDERNVEFMSDRIQLKLNQINLASVITFDYEENGEYWICSGKNIYIYNYRNDTWYEFEIYDTPTCFITIGGFLFMGTTSGQIMKWDRYLTVDFIPEDHYLTDNGHAITSIMESGFIDFGENYRRKFLNFAWVGLKPEAKSNCKVEWQTDYDVSSEPYNVLYSLVDYENTDFADHTFDVNYNPQPFRLKLKAKKFTYFKIIITNDSTEQGMTILSLMLPAQLGGVAK